MTKHPPDVRAVHARAVRPNRLDRRRRLAVALATGGAALVAVSYFLPYWSFGLVAPQYPDGLSLHIALSGVTGDVKEIDILNHYIGMRSMSDAAALESAASPYVVGAVVLSVIAGATLTSKRRGWLALLPAVALPLGFVADITWWMYRFGHELDTTAPIRFEPFMPMLVGSGTIGQFHTTAAPAPGFCLAVLAAALVAMSVYLRRSAARVAW